jgi:epoxyqueuosine reductase
MSATRTTTELDSRAAPDTRVDLDSLRTALTTQARELGFDGVGVSGVELAKDEAYLQSWLQAGRHGEMNYMQHHGLKRSRPELLVPGTVRVISVRMNYWPAGARAADATLADGEAAYISRYALGRDYHKVMRGALKALAAQMATLVAPFNARVCVDSAPVLEKALARNAGLGWIGKHTNLIAREAGSYFFLGEIYTDLPLPVDTPATAHCGSCSACIPACPTGAITAPWQLDARRCISYLTIELHGSIPVEWRSAIGNRIYGCDDCQLVCPWNKYARDAAHPDFKVRHALDSATLAQLFAWSSEDFEVRMQGSAIYRIGYERWLRNIAVALGNAPPSAGARQALQTRRAYASALVREHVEWALSKQGEMHEAVH